eukprot:2466323-Lingulodinium_polyedra.AAC.1
MACGCWAPSVQPCWALGKNDLDWRACCLTWEKRHAQCHMAPPLSSGDQRVLMGAGGQQGAGWASTRVG